MRGSRRPWRSSLRGGYLLEDRTIVLLGAHAVWTPSEGLWSFAIAFAVVYAVFVAVVRVIQEL